MAQNWIGYFYNMQTKFKGILIGQRNMLKLTMKFNEVETFLKSLKN